MKRLIFIFLFISNSVFACEKCFTHYEHLKETIDDSFEVNEKADASIEKQEGFKKGLEVGLQVAINILLSHHPEIKLTREQWDQLKDQ